jgi:hypothetical protein
LLSKLNWCFDILKIFWRKNDICWIEKKKVWRNKNQSVRIRKHVFEQKQKMQKHLLSNNPDFHLKSALFKRCFSKVGWVFQYFFWNIYFFILGMQFVMWSLWYVSAVLSLYDLGPFATKIKGRIKILSTPFSDTCSFRLFGSLKSFSHNSSQSFFLTSQSLHKNHSKLK